MYILVAKDHRTPTMSCGYAGFMARHLEQAIEKHSLHAEYKLNTLKYCYDPSWKERQEKGMMEKDEPLDLNSLEPFYVEEKDFTVEERLYIEEIMADSYDMNAQIRLTAAAQTILDAKNSPKILAELNITSQEANIFRVAQVREASVWQLTKDLYLAESQTKKRGFGYVQNKRDFLVESTGILGEDAELLKAKNLMGMTLIKANMRHHKQEAEKLKAETIAP